MRYYYPFLVEESLAEDLDQICLKASPDTKRGVEFDREIVTLEGVRLAVQVIGCGNEDSAWVQSLAFDFDGREMACSPVCEEFTGLHYLEVNDEAVDEYVIDVHAISENYRPCDIMPRWNVDSLQAFRLIAEAESAGLFTEEAVMSLKESMDLSVSDLRDLVDRIRSRWELASSPEHLCDSEFGFGSRVGSVLKTRAEAAGWSLDQLCYHVGNFVALCGIADQLDAYVCGCKQAEDALEVEARRA